MSGIKASRCHCPFSKQSQQAGAISETPSTWLTQFDPPWKSPETLPHPTSFPYEWLLLAVASQLSKSYQTRNNWPLSPRYGTSSSQPRFSAWLRLGVSKPSSSSSHLRLLYSSGRVALGKTQVGADLGLHHPGTPEPAHPVDSCKPHQSTTTLSLHS